MAPVLHNSLLVRGLLPERYAQGAASGSCNLTLPCCRGILWEESASIFLGSIFSPPQWTMGRGEGRSLPGNGKKAEENQADEYAGLSGSMFTWEWADTKCWSMPWGMGSFSHDLATNPWRASYPIWSLHFMYLCQVSNPNLTEVWAEDRWGLAPVPVTIARSISSGFSSDRSTSASCWTLPPFTGFRADMLKSAL